MSADLEAAAKKIIAEGKNANHPFPRVWAALHYVHEKRTINEAKEALWSMSGPRVPRWLIVRWARMAGLADSSTKRP